MAITGKKADKSAMSIMSIIKARGFEVSTQKTTLWGEPEVIAEGLTLDTFENIHVSNAYEDSVFAVYREGKESKLISFAKDQVDLKSLVTEELPEGSKKHPRVLSGLQDFTFAIAIVTALRDDEELKIAEGDTMLKLFVE